MRAALLALVVIVSGAGCGLFPSVEPLTDCGDACTSGSGQSTRGSGGGGGGVGGGSAGGEAGAGGQSTACAAPLGRGPAGVLVTPKGGYPEFCVDSVEVSFGDFKELLPEISFIVAGEFAELAGVECAWKPQSEVEFKSFHTMQEAAATTDYDELPAVGADWCEARIYCRWAGKDLCGHLDGTSAEPADVNLSQWFAACSDSGQYTYSYMTDVYDPAKCISRSGECGDFQQLAPAVPSSCEGGLPGLFNMSGNAWEWVDACITSVRDFEDDTCSVRGGGCNSGADTSCQAISAERSRNGEDAYTAFRCCWAAGPS